VSMLRFLFKDKENKSPDDHKAEASAQSSPRPASDSSESNVDPDTNLDFDEIRSALDQIAEVLGRGEGYDMLKMKSGDFTAVPIPLQEVVQLCPEVFEQSALAEQGHEQTKVTVLVESIFEQLSRGRVTTTVSNLVADVPDDCLVEQEKREALSEKSISLPLPLVVSCISPEELKKRTTNVDRAAGIERLPDLFTAAADAPAEVRDEIEDIAPDAPAPPEHPVTESTAPSEPLMASPEDETALETTAEDTGVESLDRVPAPAETQAGTPASEPEPVEPAGAKERPAPEAPAEPEEGQAEAGEGSEPVREVIPFDRAAPVIAEQATDEVAEPTQRAEAAEQTLSRFKPPPRPPSAASEGPGTEAAAAERKAASPAVVETATTDHVLKLCGIDLNTASVADLVSRLDGVGPRLAARIVADRERHGPFLDVLDLARVPGLGRKTFKKITGMRWPEGEEQLPDMRGKVLAFTTDGYLNVRDVAERFGELSGFEGCIVAHQDGYVLATSWGHQSKEALGAFAPQIFKKVAKYIKQLNMGKLDCMTVLLDQQPITFVPSEEIYFVAVHTLGGISRKHVRLAHGVGCRLGRLLKRKNLAA